MIEATAMTTTTPRTEPLPTRVPAPNAWHEVRKWVPDLLTVSRVPLGWYYPRVEHRPGAALGVIGAALVSDVLDGFFARRWGAATPHGAVLDAIADKYFAVRVVESLVRHERLTTTQAALLFVREAGQVALLLDTAAQPPARRAQMFAARRANVAGKVTTGFQTATCIAAHLGWRATPLLAIATAVAGGISAVTYWRRAHGT